MATTTQDAAPPHVRRRPLPPWAVPVALRVAVLRPAVAGPPPLPAYVLRPACTRLVDALADATLATGSSTAGWTLALDVRRGGDASVAVHGWMSLGDLASLAGLGDGGTPVLSVTATAPAAMPLPTLIRITNARLAGRALFTESRKQAAAAAGLATSSRYGVSAPDGPAAQLHSLLSRGDAAAAVGAAAAQLAAMLDEPAARRVPMRLLLAPDVATACGAAPPASGDGAEAVPMLLQRPVGRRLAPPPGPGPDSRTAPADAAAARGMTTVRNALAAHIGDAGLAALRRGDWEGVVDGVVLPLADTTGPAASSAGPHAPRPPAPLLDAPLESLYRELAQPDGWLVVCVRQAVR